jgi:hypothetical protein
VHRQRPADRLANQGERRGEDVVDRKASTALSAVPQFSHAASQRSPRNPWQSVGESPHLLHRLPFPLVGTAGAAQPATQQIVPFLDWRSGHGSSLGRHGDPLVRHNPHNRSCVLRPAAPLERRSGTPYPMLEFLYLADSHMWGGPRDECDEVSERAWGSGWQSRPSSPLRDSRRYPAFGCRALHATIPHLPVRTLALE